MFIIIIGGIFMSELLTVYQVSDLLQAHFNTVYEIVRQNKIQHVRIGKQIIISRMHSMNLLQVPVNNTIKEV
jgi:excisionase family DNA binding protein